MGTTNYKYLVYLDNETDAVDDPYRGPHALASALRDAHAYARTGPETVDLRVMPDADEFTPAYSPAEAHTLDKVVFLSDADIELISGALEVVYANSDDDDNRPHAHRLIEKLGLV